PVADREQRRHRRLQKHAKRERTSEPSDEVLPDPRQRVFHGRSTLLRRTDDAAEAEMTGRCVNRFREARRRPIAAAGGGRTEVRAAFDDFAWNPDLRLTRIVAFALLWSSWIIRRAARLQHLVRMPRHIPVGRPLPDVADHVVESVAVRGKSADRRRTFVSVACEVLPGELTLPRVSHMTVARQECVAPGVSCSLEPTSCGEFPLSLSRQRLAFPRSKSLCVTECDVHDRVLLSSLDGGGRTLWVSP